MYVYLDNAATSRFKPQGVYDALIYDLKHSANSGRSGHADAVNAGLKMEECRAYLLGALGGEGTHSVIFTKSCTEALNLALFGFIKGGEHVLTTANEHNAVLRPLYELKSRRMISLEVLEQEDDGSIDISKLKEAAKHADIAIFGGVCNVTGATLDIAEVAKIVKEEGCTLIIDGAQTVPLIDIRLEDMGIDMLACAGHKGLHGLQGTGFLVVKNGTPLRPLVYGGTGTYSDSVIQPVDIPEGFEAGTQFSGGIAALTEGARWSFEHAPATRKLFRQLAEKALYDLKNIGCTLYSANSDSGVIAFNIGDADSGYVASLLDSEGIAVRSGLHCAPLVHRKFGTLAQGMVRVSLGVETTPRDMLYFANAVSRIAAKVL